MTSFAELLASTEDYLIGRTKFEALYRLALGQLPAGLDPAARSETELARLIVRLEAQLSAGEITGAELWNPLLRFIPKSRSSDTPLQATGADAGTTGSDIAEQVSPTVGYGVPPARACSSNATSGSSLATAVAEIH